MRWVLAQPDDQLSLERAIVELDQIQWAFGHDKIIMDDWQGHLVKTELNRALENISAALKDELHRVFDERFGTDTEEWKEVELMPVVGMIVVQAAARFTVGLALGESVNASRPTCH